MSAIKNRSKGIKTQAMRIIRELPSGASWDDLMYQIYVRQKIEAGLADIQAGKLHTHEAIKKEFGLPA
ncbi:MAG: hypothetical protein ACO1QS_16365 [Verrucomicrobiota bacterium]